MSSEAPLGTTIARFVAALEGADWRGVQAELAPACRYACRGTVTVGAAAIVESYAAVDRWVRETFTNVRYRADVAVESERVALVTFFDHMEHGRHVLDFSCQQRLAIDDAGRIATIEHIDLPGMLERADAFNAACGVRRPGSS